MVASAAGDRPSGFVIRSRNKILMQSDDDLRPLLRRHLGAAVGVVTASPWRPSGRRLLR